ESPPPLHRLKVILNPSAETVNHHPTRAGEFSTGEMRNFHPALTNPTPKDFEPSHRSNPDGRQSRARNRPRAVAGCRIAGPLSERVRLTGDGSGHQSTCKVIQFRRGHANFRTRNH